MPLVKFYLDDKQAGKLLYGVNTFGLTYYTA